MRNGFCFLADILPTEILGKKIDTRACTAIAIELCLESDWTPEEKAHYAIGKLFGQSYWTVLAQTGCEDNPDKLDTAIVDYLAGYPEVKSYAEMNAENGSETVSSRKVKTNKTFDFTQDSDAIISAFRQVYGLSLDEVCNLHWWEFLALFRNLPSEGNSFGQIREIRTKKPEKNDSPEYRAKLAKAKRQVALKDTRTPEQKAEDRKGMFDNIDL